MKKQLIGFILLLLVLCVDAIGSSSTSTIFNLVFRSFKYPGRWKREVMVFTVKKDGIRQSGVTVYIYRRLRDGFISD